MLKKAILLAAVLLQLGLFSVVRVSADDGWIPCPPACPAR